MPFGTCGLCTRFNFDSNFDSNFDNNLASNFNSNFNGNCVINVPVV